jgi:hypothetical protein
MRAAGVLLALLAFTPAALSGRAQRGVAAPPE